MQIVKNEPLVGIITVTWNNYQDTFECLVSLLKVTYSNVLIWVVDNASSDTSLDKLKKEFKTITFIKLKENAGYAGGLNAGYKKAIVAGCSFIVGINNDTIVDENFLTPLVDFANTNNKIGVLGGKIFFHDEPNRIWSLGGFVSLLKSGGEYIGEEEVDNGQFEENKKLTLVSGCMMFINAEVLKSIGYLNENYFFRGEEWEFCYRVKKAGYDMFCIPSSKVWHKENRSHNRFAPQYIYSAYVAKIFFSKQFMPKVLWPFWLTIFYLYSHLLAARKFTQLANAKGITTDHKKLQKAIRLAFKDGLFKSKLSEADLIRCKTQIA